MSQAQPCELQDPLPRNYCFTSVPAGPQCSCYSAAPSDRGLLPAEPHRKASGNLVFLLCNIRAPLGLLEDKCEMLLFARNGAAGGRTFTMSVLLLFGTAKKKASEELGEARTVWEALQKELDSRKCSGARSEVLSVMPP